MHFKNLVAAIATFSLSGVSAMAQAVGERASGPLDQANEVGGGSSLLIIALVVALGIGIYLITKDGDNKPNSP